MKSVILVKSFLSFLLTLSGFALGYTWPVGYDPAHPQPQVSSPYGEFRKKYYTLPDNFHSGTDIPGREGAEIYALDNGRARENNDIYCWGKVISLIDSENKHWLYLHLKDLQINPNGQDIIEGQLLAKTIGPPPPYGWEAGYDDHLHLTLNNPATTEMAPIGNPLDYLPFNDPGNKSPFIWHLTNAFAKRLAFKETNNKYTKWAYAPAAGEEPTGLMLKPYDMWGASFLEDITRTSLYYLVLDRVHLLECPLLHLEDNVDMYQRQYIAISFLKPYQLSSFLYIANNKGYA